MEETQNETVRTSTSREIRWIGAYQPGRQPRDADDENLNAEEESSGNARNAATAAKAAATKASHYPTEKSSHLHHFYL